MKAFSVVLILVLAAPAAAQDVFRTPGNPELVPVDIAPTVGGAELYGVDDAGYVYYGAGWVACHHRDDPATVYSLPEQFFFDANGTRVGARTFGQVTPDGAGVLVAYQPLYPYWQIPSRQEAVRLFRTSCAELAELALTGGQLAALTAPIMRTDDPLLLYLGGPRFVRTDGGELCFTASENPGLPPEGEAHFGIICIDPATTPPTFRQLVDADGLDAALEVEPGFAKGDGIHPVDAEGWMFLDLAAAPGGRHFFVADRFRSNFSGPSVTTIRYVVERTPDGTVHNRLGPVNVGSSWHPLLGMSYLVYSAELDAMVGLVLGQEHNWEAAFDEFTHGWTGIGLRVFPLDAPGAGYLPLSRIVLARHGCREELVPFCNQLARTTVHAQDGELLLSIYRVGDNPNANDFDFYRLELDAASLDLDDDVLDADAEAAAGTWDTLSDSDFGGTPDNIELGLAASDPLDTRAEPARAAGVPSPLRYVPSRLINKHLEGVSGNAIRNERPRTVGIDNPVCTGGGCFGPDGRVASYPVERQLGGSSSVIAADGSFIMLRTTEGLVRFYFADGREELAVPEDALNAYVPTWSLNDSSLMVIPLDAERTLLVVDGQIEPENYPAVVALADGDAVAILFDLSQATRDSGLTLPTDRVANWFQLIGWNADTAKLHIGVRGNWESWLLALGLDGSVTLLGRGRALVGINEFRHDMLGSLPSLFPPPFPAYLLPTGHGEYFAGGAVMEPFGSYLPAFSTTISNMTLPPLAIWGDVLLDTVCCGLNEDGLYELVRYDQSVAPGDVLLLMQWGNAAGVMLHKSGPRGGLAELWAAPMTDLFDVGGIDLEPDAMHLCIADRGGDVVWELEPAGAGGVPELVRYVADVPGIIDCAYEPDGTLIVLATGPVRVEARAGDFGDLAVRDTLASAPEPLDLVLEPDGTHEVRVRDGLRGKAYLPDGRVISMKDGDMAMRIDDAIAFGADFGERLVFQSAEIDYGPAHPARVAFAVRPDGGIVIAPFDGEPRPPYALQARLLIADPSYVGPLAVGTYYAASGLAMVVVPGGSSADPWTGRLPVGANDQPPGPRRHDAPPASDSAPSGCTGGNAASALWISLALLTAAALRGPGAAIRARRRRR